MRRILFLFLFLSVGCGDGTIFVNNIDQEPPPKSTNGIGDPNNGKTPQPNNGGPGDPTDPDPTDPDPTDPTDPTDPNNNTLPPCAQNEARCDGVCVDVMSNPMQCGSCDIMCDSGSCEQGVCEPEEPLTCPTGQVVCDMMCVSTDSNAAHCGSCDNACGGGMLCVSGVCEQPSEIVGVWTLTNDARATGANCGSEGNFGPANPLDLDPELNIAAQAHADDMAANNFFSHTGSDGSSFSQRIFRTNFTGSPVGENIAAGYNSPQAAVNGWLTSDGHCRNMLNPQATKLGVGYALGGPYGTLWVQVFGR